MLGNGRPFVVELVNPRRVVFTPDEMAALQAEINRSPAVQVLHLQQVSPADADVIHEGQASKRKRYLALIWGTNMRDFEAHDILIHQKTPIRVMHRRALMTRPRTVYDLRIVKITGEYGVMFVETEAGTYIKEFVHGDLGRTTPSVCEILGCDCDILSLDVIGVCLAFPPPCRDEPLPEVSFDVPPFVALDERARQFCREKISENQ